MKSQQTQLKRKYSYPLIHPSIRSSFQQGLNKEFYLPYFFLDYNHQENITVSKKRGAVIELPNKEFLLLQKLIMSSNQIFTRQQLMNAIWGPDSDSEERTIDVHIKRLRTKFKNNPDFKILTIRGLGYKVVLTHD